MNLDVNHRLTRDRLDEHAALQLLTKAPLGELMAAAHAERTRRFPEGRVTFGRDVTVGPSVFSAPLVRSSFHAAEIFVKTKSSEFE